MIKPITRELIREALKPISDGRLELVTSMNELRHITADFIQAFDRTSDPGIQTGTARWFEVNAGNSQITLRELTLLWSTLLMCQEMKFSSGADRGALADRVSLTGALDVAFGDLRSAVLTADYVAYRSAKDGNAGILAHGDRISSAVFYEALRHGSANKITEAAVEQAHGPVEPYPFTSRDST